MNLKQLFTNSIIGIFILFSTPVYAYAVTTAIPPQNMKYEVSNPVGSSSGIVKVNPTLTAGRSDSLQKRAASEIQRRITALNGLVTKINSFKHLSNTQKSNLINQIQTEIANLTALGIKIQADTDPVILKTDVQSIVTSFRVYALFMSQIRLLAAANSALDIANKMSTLSGSLQTRITAAQAAGQDTSSLQTLLSDMQAKIADAKTKANLVITTVTPLTPAGYPANVTTLQSAKAFLQTAISDLKTAKNDARQIIVALMNFGNSSSKTSTNSARPNTLAPLVPKQGIGANPSSPQGTTQEAPAANTGTQL